ncbi:MAG: hypothetical protein VB061_02515 [Christensenella sp.]|nr:hypothetical protein [Christensenella sp.]
MRQKKLFRTWSKRILGAAFALICVFSFLPTAHAEEARINITANPTELVDGGPVTFTFEIANYNADYPMTDVAITYNGTAYDVLHGAQIAPSGSARDITLNLNVAQSQLGKPITFLVTWNRNGEPMSQEAQYTIAQAENPVIAVTRTADKTNAKPGEKVTITYTIKNTTKFDMTDITLIDENVSDSAIFQNETLRASRTTSYDFTYTMGDESVTSAPVVTYTVNGKAKSFSSLDPLELTMVLIQLDMKVQAGTPTSSGVTFTIDVTNTGTQTISNISISDERENLVNETPFQLDPGEHMSFSFVVVPLMTEPLRNVQFHLTGVDPFSNAYELSPTDLYEVYPYVDASQINVTVRADTITPWTQENGKVSAHIVITNHSTVELTNITITESILGVVKNYDILPAAETAFDQEFQLGSPRNLNFTVKGYDPTGTNRVLANCVMPIAYGTESTPEVTATPTQTAGSSFTIFGGVSNGIVKVLIGLGILMVLAFVILVALTVMERSRASRRAFDSDDDDDYFEEPPVNYSRQPAYHDAPDPEEISYTKRMFAIKDEEPFFPKQEPIRLPAAVVKPSEQPRVVFSPQAQNVEPVVTHQTEQTSFRRAETVQQIQPEPLQPSQQQPEVTLADQLAQRLVETARTRYGEAQSSAAYRPASNAVKPYEPQQTPIQASAQAPTKATAQTTVPRVFDYKKQAKVQPVKKQTITHIHKSAFTDLDDEE